MGFAEIVNPIPFLLSHRTFGGASYQLDTDAYDIALGGYPFLLATNDQRPYIREILNSRKEMFDNFAEPGEYSLTDWWLRSQQDFGGGAGLVYQDPDVDARFNLKFKQSTGINPWDPGDLKLLPAPIPVSTTFGSDTKFQITRSYRSGGVDKAWRLTSSLYAYDPIADTETLVDYTGGGPPDSDTESFTASGDVYYVATKTAVYTGTDDNAGSKLWTFADPAPGEDGAVLVGFVKQRLMMGYANSLYEMVPPVGAPPHALPATPVFTHLNPAWRWRSMTDGPNAIYATGNDGTTSAIYKFTLDADGAVPTLTSGGTITASFPDGEIVNTLNSYLGTFIGISTNLGFRVGEIDSNGDISYGPLLWNKPCYEQAGYDRFMYVRVEDGIVLDPEYQDDSNPPDDVVLSCLYRVDLGQREQEQSSGAIRFAYASDVYAQHTQTVAGNTFNLPLRAFTILSNKFIFGVTGSDTATLSPLYLDYWPTDFELERSTAQYDLLESGWIQTGRVRYNTLEPKLFRYFSVRAPAPLLGEIDVDVIDEAGSATRYITYTGLVPPDVDDIPLTGMDTPKTYMSLRFTLHNNPSEPTEGAVMNGWQIKALPAPRRQRQFTFSVMCFDKEQDKTGQVIGYEGYALERIERMEAMAQSSGAFLLQDLYNTTGSQVVILSMQFVQMAPPGNNQSGWGGYITFQVKTVADVI